MVYLSSLTAQCPLVAPRFWLAPRPSPASSVLSLAVVDDRHPADIPRAYPISSGRLLMRTYVRYHEREAIDGTLTQCDLVNPAGLPTVVGEPRFTDTATGFVVKSTEYGESGVIRNKSWRLTPFVCSLQHIGVRMLFARSAGSRFLRGRPRQLASQAT